MTLSRRRLPHADPALTAAQWAAPLLAVTLVMGTWMRAVLLWPALGAGLRFDHLVHAHSHVAFFGWIVLGVTAFAARRAGLGPARARALSRVAVAVGLLSVAALVTFALEGYGPVSIALSAVHVVLWVALARLLWPAARATTVERTLLRLALVLLVAAGTATLLPGILKARGVHDGWLREFGIKLFLATFIHGFVGLAAMAAIASRLPQPRRALFTAGLSVAGVLPMALLYVATPAPASWMLPVGRLGAALIGAGTLWFGIEAARAPLPPLLRAAAWGASVAGVLELLAAAGVGLALIHGRPITLAVSHLLLLGVATPCILHACRDRVATAPLATLAAGGGALMIGTLAVMGWPWALTHLVAAGIDFTALLRLCLLGGALAAAALLATLVSLVPVMGHPHELPVVAARPAEPADARGALPAL